MESVLCLLSWYNLNQQENSSFGFSGTNAHILLSDHYVGKSVTTQAEGSMRQLNIMPFSAKSKNAVQQEVLPKTSPKACTSIGSPKRVPVP